MDISGRNVLDQAFYRLIKEGKIRRIAVAFTMLPLQCLFDDRADQQVGG